MRKLVREFKYSDDRIVSRVILLAKLPGKSASAKSRRNCELIWTISQKRDDARAMMMRPLLKSK